MTTSRRNKSAQSDLPLRPPATTPQDRENDMIALAVNLAEKQMREGTASSQLITHYVKLGSSREKLEQERLAMENELSQAKIEQLASQQRVEELYAQALQSMRAYQGNEPLEIESEYDD